jgi:hypothetical protein
LLGDLNEWDILIVATVDDIDITCFAFRNLGYLERRETGPVLFSLIVQAIGSRIKIN